MAPRPLFRRFLQHSHLGALVEELEYAEIGFPGCEDEVLDINELDEACPRLYSLALRYHSWREGSGASRSSYLSRHTRALSKASCNLSPRLRDFCVTALRSPLDPTPGGAVPIKLGKMLERCTRLERVKVGLVTLVGRPSASPPPCLGIVVAIACDAHSFLRLATILSVLEKICIEAVFRTSPPTLPSVAVSGHPLRRLIYVASSDKSFDRAYFQQFDTFLAAFPRLKMLQISFKGGRAPDATASIDLHRLPNSLCLLQVDGPLSVTQPEAGPTPEEMKMWIASGGGPSLKLLTEVNTLGCSLNHLKLAAVCERRRIQFQLRVGENYSLGKMDAPGNR